MTTDQPSIAGHQDWYLRSATPGDVPAVAALAIQVFLDTYATDGIRPDLAREALDDYGPAAFAQRLAEPGRRLVLACVGEALLGFAEWLQAPSRAAPDLPLGAELLRLYVQPAQQRGGIGRALLRQVEAEAMAVGHQQLWLTAWSGNTRARTFYAALNYADLGAVQIEIQGQRYENRVLAKSLFLTSPELPDDSVHTRALA